MTAKEARKKASTMETVYVLFNDGPERYEIEPCIIYNVDVTYKDWFPGKKLEESVCFLGVKRLCDGKKFKVESGIVFSSNPSLNTGSIEDKED